MAGRTKFIGRPHMLPILAYFMYLGGDPEPMTMAASDLADLDKRMIILFGRETYIDGVPASLWAWMEKQVRRVEHVLYGATRPAIEHYLVGIVRRAGSSRTVGRETSPMAVPDC